MSYWHMDALNHKFYNEHYSCKHVFPEKTMKRSERITFIYEIGKATFELPSIYEYGSIIEGKVCGIYIYIYFCFNDNTVAIKSDFFLFVQIKLQHLKGTPIPNKQVYVLEAQNWQHKMLLNLTTDDNGFASFSLNTSTLPKRDIELRV